MGLTKEVLLHSRYSGPRLIAMIAIAENCTYEGVCVYSRKKLADVARMTPRNFVKVLAQIRWPDDLVDQCQREGWTPAEMTAKAVEIGRELIVLREMADAGDPTSNSYFIVPYPGEGERERKRTYRQARKDRIRY